MRKVFPRCEAFSSSVYKSTYSGLFILSENFGFFTTFLKKKKTRLEYRAVITETEKQPSKNHEQIRSNNSKQDQINHYHHFIFRKSCHLNINQELIVEGWKVAHD